MAFSKEAGYASNMVRKTNASSIRKKGKEKVYYGYVKNPDLSPKVVIMSQSFHEEKVKRQTTQCG